MAASMFGIQRANGVRSSTSTMYQIFLVESQRAPRALTASFSAKGVTRLILIDGIISAECTSTHTPDHHNRTNAETEQLHCHQTGKKKAPAISRKGLIRLDFLAPRPGLEPGTYGLTEAPTPSYAPCKTMILKVFFASGRSSFWMPNRKPNRWWQWCRRWPKKSNRINELREWSVEPAKTERADRTGPNWNSAGGGGVGWQKAVKFVRVRTIRLLGLGSDTQRLQEVDAGRRNSIADV